MIYSFRNQCKGKKSFPNHLTAGCYLGYLRKQPGNDLAKVLEPYLCPWCETWHLGHKSDDPEVQEQRKAERLDAIKTEEILLNSNEK